MGAPAARENRGAGKTHLDSPQPFEP